MKFFDKYYQILEIPPDSDMSQVKTAYRRLAKSYHPDRSGDERTRAQFIEVNEAYEMIVNKDAIVLEAVKRYQKKQQTGKASKDMFEMRQRAKSHADMAYEAFEKTKIYHTAKVMNSAADYFFLFVGVIMISSPVVGYFSDMERATIRGEEPEFNLYPIIFGIFFIYGVWYFVFHKKDDVEPPV